MWISGTDSISLMAFYQTLLTPEWGSRCHNACRAPPSPVEAPHHEDLDILEHSHPSVGERNAVGLEDQVAQPFVFDAVCQVHTAMNDPANGEFEDVAGGSDAQRTMPAVVQPRQGRLFLGAGDRDPEIVIPLHAERHGGVVAQNVGDL